MIDTLSWKNTFFTNSCELCSAPMKSALSLCRPCTEDLPIIKSACTVCGRALIFSGICGQCLKKMPPVDKAISAFPYCYPTDQLIKNIKYKQRLGTLITLGHMLYRRITSVSTSFPEAMIPVPLHSIRFYKRGFNQSAEICKTLEQALHIKYDNQIVMRVRNTQPMNKLNPTQRKQNVRGAFVIKQPCRYKSVAIVDDVITSGATAYELARLLKSNGVKHVELWSLARA
jgi:ComF family protein